MAAVLRQYRHSCYSGTRQTRPTEPLPERDGAGHGDGAPTIECTKAAAENDVVFIDVRIERQAGYLGDPGAINFSGFADIEHQPETTSANLLRTEPKRLYFGTR